jgi:hypothetical protein
MRGGIARTRGTRGRTVTLKVKFLDFEIISRSRSSQEVVSDSGELERISVDLLRNLLPLSKAVRLLGVPLSSLQGDVGETSGNWSFLMALGQVHRSFGCTVVASFSFPRRVWRISDMTRSVRVRGRSRKRRWNGDLAISAIDGIDCSKRPKSLDMPGRLDQRCYRRRAITVESSYGWNSQRQGLNAAHLWHVQIHQIRLRRGRRGVTYAPARM